MNTDAGAARAPYMIADLVKHESNHESLTR